MDVDENIEASRSPKRGVWKGRPLLWLVVGSLALVLLSCGAVATFVTATNRTFWIGVPNVAFVQVGRSGYVSWETIYETGTTIAIPSADSVLLGCGDRPHVVHPAVNTGIIEGMLVTCAP